MKSDDYEGLTLAFFSLAKGLFLDLPLRNPQLSATVSKMISKPTGAADSNPANLMSRSENLESRVVSELLQYYGEWTLVPLYHLYIYVYYICMYIRKNNIYIYINTYVYHNRQQKDMKSDVNLAASLSNFAIGIENL